MVLLIVGIIYTVLGLTIILAIVDTYVCELITSTLIAICIGMALLVVYFTNEPQAIDVYQGKTTLEITYKDGVPVDSVVVFK